LLTSGPHTVLPALAASASCGQRFLREAEAMAAVEHDHIVRIYQIDEERNVPFMAMEFLKGEPLDERLKRDEPIPLVDMLRIGREIAEGLAAAHATGLIHRDIKPGNIWLESRGEGRGARDDKSAGAILAPHPSSLAPRVKILDFGLARAASQEAGLTQQGAIIGTPAYMSPEQGRGESVDARCDLFSLGVVLYRMSTGQQPFVGNDTVSTLVAVAMNEPAVPIKLNSDLPQTFSDLVMKLLEKDPAQRHASAGEVIRTLQGIEKKLELQRVAEERTETMNAADEKHGVTDRPPHARAAGSSGQASSASPRAKRRPAALIALAASLLFIVAGGAVIYWQTNNGTVRIEINDPAIQIAFDDKDLLFKGIDKQDIRVSPGEHGLHIKRGELELDSDKFILKKGETVTLKVEWVKDGKLQVMQGDKVIGKAEVAVAPPVPIPAPAADFALLFNPTNHVTVPTLAVDLSDPFTMEGYFKQTEFAAGNQTVLRFQNHANLKSVVATTKSWNFQIPAAVAAGKTFGLYSNVHVALDKTVHVAVVSDTKQVRLYVNGALRAKHDIGADKPFKTKKNHLEIGHEFSGVIDEVRISKIARYDKDFKPAERFEPDKDTLALYHFDEGQGDVLKDASGHGHHGKIVGAKWVKADGSPSTFPPLDPAWLEQVAALSAKEQIETVKAELMKRNPGFDGKMDSQKVQGGMVTELAFAATKVKDISPLRALTGLQRLKCAGSSKEKGQLADLTPLEGLKLTFLNCSWTQVPDLTSLKDMKLSLLHFQGTKVSDLTPVKEMKLTDLGCGNTAVTDLAPLKDMKLIKLDLVATGVSDLSPLQGMPLTYLGFHFTKVTDLSPLQGMPLTFVKMENTRVADIAPLRGMPLKTLDISFVPKRDAEILRSITTLETINGQSRDAFWKDVDAKNAGK